MKVIARVGSESHTSSNAFASLVDKDGNTLKGKLQPDEEFTRLNARWFLVEIDVPAGTVIRYKAGGRDGARGVNKYRHDTLYRVAEDAEVAEITPDLGPAQGLIKGRLIPVGKNEPAKIDTAAGF